MAPSAVTHSPAGSVPASDLRLEDYLDHVSAPLVGVVPFARRQELRAELRAHLMALIATHEELGSSPDVAVVAALRQFGDPGRLARQWVREWGCKTLPTPLRPLWTAVPAALGCFALATLVGLALLLSEKVFNPPGVAGWAAWMLSLWVLPILAGLGTGLRASARHAMGTFVALTAIIPCLAVVTLTNDASSGLTPPAEAATDLALILAVLWTPIGCGSAALGGWLRDRLPRRRARWVLQ
jgi:hypothetical protein